VVEASSLPGGTAGTLSVNGFKLDNSIHILYFKNQEIKDWILNTLQIELVEKKRESFVWVNNSYVSFPIQYHLANLPFTSRLKSFFSILNTVFYKRKTEFENFEDYSISTSGTYLTDIFIRPYNKKLFGTPINKINIDWMGDYVPKHSRIKMLISLTRLVNNHYGRNSTFYYPAKGGISEIALGITSKLKNAPIFNSSLTSLSLNRKIAKFNNGVVVNYKYLINTIPLKSFLEKIDDLSSDISNYSKSLKKNSTTVLHLLCEGNFENNTYHWVYVPDSSIPFHRITIPGNINSANCPAGYFALTLEFGGDVYENNTVYKSSIAALNRMGFLNKDVTIIESYWRLLECGYVIYDNNRRTILQKIFPFLQSKQIWSVGRYGGWEYSNMEDAIISGKKVAEQLLNFI